MHISLGHKKQNEEHIKRFEDALTSAFFGTLRYLPSRFVVDLLISVLKARNLLVIKDLTGLLVDDVIVEMEFWPNLLNKGRVEPDLMIYISHGLSKVNFLIECKWKSGESSDCQLHSQWNSLSQDDRLNTYHIYLVRNFHDGNSTRYRNIKKASDAKNWDDRLYVISWLDLRKALPMLSINGLNIQSARAVIQWKNDMAAMFDRIDIQEFGGFSVISDNFEFLEGPVFWSGPFHGFQAIVNEDIHSSQDLVFFE